MGLIVFNAKNTGFSDDLESRTKYPMMQLSWLKPGYIVTKHCQAGTSKMKSGYSDTLDDAHNSGEASQTTKGNESSDKFY